MHYMIDIETLGTGDFAPVIQIAASRFSADGADLPHLGFRRNILARDWLNIDGETLLWWMRQDPEARASVFDQAEAVPICQALHELAAFTHDAETVWADSPSFDLRLLRQAWSKFGMLERWPFTHRQERDLRTLKNMRGAMELAPDREDLGLIEHDALHDAFYQALFVVTIHQRLVPIL